ncbi:MAG TPA: hypothetical protein VKA18_15135, partial [Alphaproteobacteria bacterium]|nr:hypothetical protein [Alphaproteobacteria bacterium]
YGRRILDIRGKVMDSFSRIFLPFAIVAAVLVATPLFGAPPACPGHPSCKDGDDNGGGEDPPSGDECSAYPDFPAVVYQVETIENEGHPRKEAHTYDIYLANRDRSCSLLIYSGPQRMGARPSYRQLPDSQTGKIIAVRDASSESKQCTPPAIIGLSFDVNANAVLTSLPLSWQTIYEWPECGAGKGGIHSQVLSPDGTEIFYFTEEPNPDPQYSWLDSLNVIDLTQCNTNCTPSRIRSWDERALERYSMNPDGTRIYMAGHDRIADTYSVSFVERDSSGTWSEVQDVVNSNDPAYSLDQFGEGTATAATMWAYDGESHAVVAFGRGDGTSTSDIMNVDDCDVFDKDTSCLAAGKASLVPGHGTIQGQVLGFTNLGSEGPGPNTFVVIDSNVHEIDLDSNTNLGPIVPDVDVNGVDSAE